MQSDGRLEMGINKLADSSSIDLMERGRMGWIRQVVVWGGILLIVALVQECILTTYYLLLRVVINHHSPRSSRALSLRETL